jgi:hypothetical protein
MDTPHVPVEPPSENESAATQPWEGDGYPSESDDEVKSTKEHNLTAEVYNKIFLDGFRNAMKTIFEDIDEEYDIPYVGKTPPADMNPVEAFRQGYNLAIAESIVESGGRGRSLRNKTCLFTVFHERLLMTSVSGGETPIFP